MTAALLALAGAFTWTFLEYVIHRWLGHDRRYRRTPFGVEHVRHHVEGNYFAPTWKKLGAAAVVAAILLLPAMHLLGRAGGAAYVGGLIGFYGVYEVIHRLEHVWPGIGPYARWARRHHFTHHFIDARKNHGVTTPLWDLVFGTYLAPRPMVVPARLAMPWLRGGVPKGWEETFTVREGAQAPEAG